MQPPNTTRGLVRPHGLVTPGQATHGQVTPGRVNCGQAIRGQVIPGRVPHGPVTRGQVTRGQVTRGRGIIPHMPLKRVLQQPLRQRYRLHHHPLLRQSPQLPLQ